MLSFIKKHKYKLGIAIIVILGFIFRLRFLLIGRSFWGDEVKLALIVQQQGLIDLLGPLPFNQSAPFGYLAMVEMLSRILGFSEVSLRLTSFLAGIAIPIAGFFLLQKVYQSRLSILFGVIIFSFLDTFIYYSSELKQYSTDILISIFIVYLFFELKDRKFSINFKESLSLSILLSLCFVSSATAVFYIVPFTIVILIKSIHLERKHSKYAQIKVKHLPLLIGFILNSISIAIIYFSLHSSSASNNYFYEYWTARGGFFELNKLSISLISENFEKIIDGFAIAQSTISKGFGILTPVVFFLALTALAYYLVNKKYNALVIIFAPIALTIAAATLGIYPFAERLILFLSPVIIIALLTGLERSCSWAFTSFYYKCVFAFLSAIIFLQPTLHTLSEFSTPTTKILQVDQAYKHIASTSSKEDSFIYLDVGFSLRYYSATEIPEIIGYSWKEIYLHTINLQDWQKELTERNEQIIWVLDERNLKSRYPEKIFNTLENNNYRQIEVTKYGESNLYKFESTTK